MRLRTWTALISGISFMMGIRAYALAPPSEFQEFSLGTTIRYPAVGLPQALCDIRFKGPARVFGAVEAYGFIPSAQASAFLDQQMPGADTLLSSEHFVLAIPGRHGIPVPFAITREDARAKKIWSFLLMDELRAPATWEPNVLLQEYLVLRQRIKLGSQIPLKETDDVQDIAISYDTYKFVDSAGRGYHGLANNLQFVHAKKDGSEQVIGVFSNHGEAEAFFRFHHGRGHTGLRGRSVGIWHFDGHADDLASGQQRPLEPRPTFAECYEESLYHYGITNFLGGSVLNGVLYAKKWFFKNTFDGINYREVMRWAGPHYPGEPVHFDHAPTEGNLVSDEGMVAMNLDIVDVDLDIFHSLDDPVAIGRNLRYLAKLARRAKMVTFITSPGWIDQELAVLCGKIVIEILRGTLTSEKADHYAGALLERLEKIALENEVAAGPGKAYRFEALRESSQKDKEALREQFKGFFLQRDDQIALASIPPDPDVHFYHGMENLRGLQKGLRKDFVREYEALRHALQVSSRSRSLRIDALEGDAKAVSQEDAVALAATLGDPPHAFNRFFREENPLEFALFKIGWHLTSGRYEDPMRLLKTIFGLLKNTALRVELRHNLLGFLSVFGNETDLFEFSYAFDYLHNWEILNWRSRLSAISGYYVDAQSRDALERTAQQRAFTVFDLAAILSIDGGGLVTAQRIDGSLEVFGYRSGKQDSTESYALQLIHGKFQVADRVQAARVKRLRAQFKIPLPPAPSEPDPLQVQIPSAPITEMAL